MRWLWVLFARFVLRNLWTKFCPQIYIKGLWTVCTLEQELLLFSDAVFPKMIFPCKIHSS